MNILRGAYGDSIPDPSDILVTDWNINPLSYGTWSMMPVGWEFEDLKVLGRNEGQIYFAGEHLSMYRTGTLDGALDNGTKVACDLLGQMGVPCAQYIS